MTHYLPAFTQSRSRLQMASCGAFIAETEHSSEPTCPRCAAWILRDADDEASLFASLGYVTLRPGVMGPNPTGSKPEP